MPDIAIDLYYVVPRLDERDAMDALKSLNAFVNTPTGHVRLEGPDRVVVWRQGGTLYLSPGALSLAGYLDPDPANPRSPELCGPEITPSRIYGPSIRASVKIDASQLPAARVLVLGRP